jgi:mono/diheme cytochrome c family protein
MTHRFARAALAAAVIALVSPAAAQSPGDAAKGARLAFGICAQCHAVGRGSARSPDPMAPRFSSVATTPGMTDMALRVWLLSAHPTMPNFVLTKDETDDLVAYIMGLKAGRSAL